MENLPQNFVAGLMAGEIPAIAAAALFAVALGVGVIRIIRQPKLVMNNLQPGATPGLLALVLLTLFASLGLILASYA